MSANQNKMSELENHILSSQKFQALVRRRNRFMWLLFAISLVIFFGFSLLVMFAPEVLGFSLWPGSATTIGIPIGMGVVFISFILTGIYVYRANGEFDQLTKEVLDEARKATNELD